MSDADEFGLLAERYAGPLVLKPDRVRGLEARYADAHEFIEEDTAVCVAPAFRHELVNSPTTYGIMIPHKSAHSIEAHEPGRIVHVRRERLTSQIDVERTFGVTTRRRQQLKSRTMEFSSIPSSQLRSGLDSGHQFQMPWRSRASPASAKSLRARARGQRVLRRDGRSIDRA